MPFRLRKIILFIIAVLLTSVNFYLFVSADTTQQTINVNMNVPTGEQGCSGSGCGTGDNMPSIANVVATSTQAAAVVTWTASDDKGISSASFIYGLTTNYGNNSAVSGNYSVNLTGLASSTVYYFKITVLDTAGQSAHYAGSFITLSLPPPPPEPDIIPPIISQVLISIGITTSSISWQTDEEANSRVDYGLTSSYGSNYFEANRVLSRAVLLFNLLPNTVYNYKITSADAAGNSASTANAVFTTLKDNLPPPNVSNLTMATTSAAIILNWSNPSLLTTPDFVGVKVLRKAISAPGGHNDATATMLYTGSNNSLLDNGVSKGVRYYYTVYSRDTSDNYSSGVSANDIIIDEEPPPIVEICTDGIDNDNDGKVDCADSDCAELQICRPIPVEICTDGIDNDNDGKVDCADADCQGSAFCQGTQVEICNNGIDDDNDGSVDCADSDCAGFSGCASDKKDDQDDKYVPIFGGTVPLSVQIKLTDLIFLTANRQIMLAPQNGQVVGLAGAGLTAGVPKGVLSAIPLTMALKMSVFDQHQFVFNSVDETYYAEITFPAVGSKQAYLEIDYGAGQFDSLSFEFVSLPWGDVLSDNKRLAGAEITVYQKNGLKMAMENFGQSNPIITNANGIYGWLVPNGEYYIIALKEGYYERTVPNFEVSNNVVNLNLNLILKPPPLKDLIKPGAPLTENVKTVAKVLSLQTKAAVQKTAQNVMDTAKIINRAADNPEVEKAARQMVAPTAVGVVAMGTLPFISWLDLLPFLRLLFLQPLMIVGRRKREKWGQVYNVLNKLPIDLAVVRLIEAVSGKLVHTQVTDKQGRYVFIVEPGQYRLEVQKSNFVFPTSLLANHQVDGRRLDIYHGEVIAVTEKDAVITANIPLDAAGEQKKPARLGWEKFGRRVQRLLAGAGFLAAVVSLYIAPTWYVAVLLGAHLVLFFLFRRLSAAVKPKGWGIVYEADIQKPIKRAIARLFNAEFNKLISTQITDRDGRYSFLVGDDRYYVTFDHPNYQSKQTEIIDLRGKAVETIAHDVALQKKGAEISQQVSDSGLQPAGDLTQQVKSEVETIQPIIESPAENGETGAGDELSPNKKE